jgi:outer membrane murein-binding lipoprotein Lpp
MRVAIVSSVLLLAGCARPSCALPDVREANARSADLARVLTCMMRRLQVEPDATADRMAAIVLEAGEGIGCTE